MVLRISASILMLGLTAGVVLAWRAMKVEGKVRGTEAEEARKSERSIVFGGLSD